MGLDSPMTKPARISFGILALTLVLAGWLHLATPLLVVLFSTFALHTLRFTQSKWVAVALFTGFMLVFVYCAPHFIKAVVVALPKIADTSIPVIIGWAQHQGVELPFTDFESLKSLGFETVKEQVHYLGTFAKGAT